jgi:hypothetical protein
MSMTLLKPPQWTVFNSHSRFRILVAGRRFGKTFLSLVELCRVGWNPGRLAWYVAPTYKQAKRIAWKPLPTLLGIPTQRDRSENRADNWRHDLLARGL